MNTDEELERQLRSVLRGTLDGELGPDPVWPESPAARRVAELDHRRRRRWPLRVLAVAALIGAGGAAALLGGRLNPPPPEVSLEASNGWIAFAVAQGPAGDADNDIWFAALGQEPRRVIGTDTDDVDQVCPAFSPDGRSIAYGSIEVVRSTGDDTAHRNSALVIADVDDDGTVADRLTVDVGAGLPPPCPVWSRDGDRLAIGVPRTSPINPVGSGEGSEVWVVRLSDGDITVIPNLLAADLDWSPDGSLLAIAGPETSSDGLQDARINLYELSTGTLRTLDDTIGVGHLAWSPDGGRIAFDGRGAEPDSPVAYDSRAGLRVIDVETGLQEILANGYRAFHGIGPVWSPDGETIAYQRLSDRGGERHEVVLLTPDDRSEQTGLASEVVMPIERTTADGSDLELAPWRVTWSPDGTYLLYVAWTNPTATSEQTVVVAVPTDQDAPAVLLADVDGIAAYDSSDDMRVPTQIWGRQPSD